MPIHGKYIPPAGATRTGLLKTHSAAETKSNQAKFSAHLHEAIQRDGLKISKHARHRLEERQIAIDDASWQKITEKVHEAKKMGVTDSLVLLDDAALIVSAKNKTVITAMDRSEAKSEIFTNINGTIIID